MSVTAAPGFKAAGVAAGIKRDGDLDLAVVVSDRPVPAAAVFTTSTTAAPPVLVSRRNVAGGTARVVVVNSGCANAGTGRVGLEAAERTAAAAAGRYGCEPEQVLVCSTGPIGPALPVERLIRALPDTLGDDEASGLRAAEAIMTTDSAPKEALAAGDGFVVGGMAKGAGMVRPDMAKMLAVITTDAGVDSFTLRTVLQQAVDVSFNSLNIDGCQSTNDTVVVLASGGSAVQPAPEEFAGALTDVCGSLARQIAADAEGATRVVALRVSGATGDGEARLLGKWVADSDLVRSSFFGGDPNWGRIFGALGVGPVPIEPDAIVVRFAGVEVAREGCAVGFDRAALLEILDSGDFTVDIEVGDGPGRAEILTTDLTPDYVRFNGEPS